MAMTHNAWGSNSHQCQISKTPAVQFVQSSMMITARLWATDDRRPFRTVTLRKPSPSGSVSRACKVSAEANEAPASPSL
ncbi:hypothetical protein CI238_11688 [Colletotrichum incanum]|uniref:Uncharacterized protein n=1 Tax=Colletotrichum incanum TaxID=1573173 RepID=A0A161Y8T0_COLIC|nr:hypothetical protein CI238_11688 [Colletotrichum incanum]